MASTSSGSLEVSPASTATSTTSEASSLNTAAMNAPEKPPDDTSKMRMFLSILRKFIGVSDMASVRFSLPAQLLEPTPNLEYWNYLDDPRTFIAIGDSDEPLERMLEVLRFWFTKDLKYVKGKPCKPYNSTLGEFFRCIWEVEDTAPAISAKPIATAPSSAASSIKSVKAIGSRSGTPQLEVPTAPAIRVSKSNKPVRVSYLTEQTSHHPPVSAFYITCPEKGINARGFDQLAAKFTGTSIKVTAGEHNLGIFITLEKHNNETYQLTHPAAHLGGLLRGSLSISVGDQCYITCAETRMKTILQYMDESWLGKVQNRVDGVIFRYDPENDDKTRIKDVPERDILARISGNWRERLNFSLGPKSDAQSLLIDLSPLSIAPKIVPPTSSQLPNESRRFWSDVTAAIIAKQFSRATVLKQELEERQRVKARAREESGVEWTPVFFTEATTKGGQPHLTPKGEEALRRLATGVWELDEGEGNDIGKDEAVLDAGSGAAPGVASA